MNIESIKAIVLADKNSYFAFRNPYGKIKDSLFFKLMQLDSFLRYATEYAYKNHILDKYLRNKMHSKWSKIYKLHFFEDRRLYNLATEWSVIKDSHFEYPCEVWIAPSNICNTNCLLCPWFGFNLSQTLSNDYFQTEKKIATLQMENILRYLGKARAKCVFSGPGEPLLDERLERFVRYARECGVPSVEIATNGVLLTPKKFLELIMAGVDSLVINVYFTKETYDVCGEDFFEIFKQNLIEIVKLIEDLRISISIQFAIVYQEHRIVEMLEFWNCITSLSKRITVGFPCRLEENGEYVDWLNTAEMRATQQRHSCSAPFASLYIFPSGDVGICEHQRYYLGREDVAKFCLGNVYEQDLEEIWNGVAHKHFCKAHNSMDFAHTETSYCNSCGQWWNEL